MLILSWIYYKGLLDKMDIKQLTEAIEQVSQIYAKRLNIERDSTWFLLKLQEEVGELTQSYLMFSGKARTKGKTPEEIQGELHNEIADVFCQILLLSHFYNVDLEKVIEQKWLLHNQQYKILQAEKGHTSPLT